MERLYENAYQTCDYDAATDTYIIFIKPNTAEMTDYECRRETDNLLQHIKQWQPRLFLLDLRAFSFLTIPQTFTKIHQAWHTTLGAIAIEKFALVLGDNSISTLIRKTLKISPQQPSNTNYQKACFSNLEDAQKWLEAV